MAFLLEILSDFLQRLICQGEAPIDNRAEVGAITSMSDRSPEFPRPPDTGQVTPSKFSHQNRSPLVARSLDHMLDSLFAWLERV